MSAESLLLSVRQVLIDRLAHGAERGALIRGSTAGYSAAVEAVMGQSIKAKVGRSEVGYGAADKPQAPSALV